MRSWLRRLRGFLCLTQLLVAGGCAVFAYPVATPSTSGLQRIPLRVAVVLTKEDKDWGGTEYYEKEGDRLVGLPLPSIRQYGRTGLTYCTVVGCSEREQSHMQKEAGHGEGYYLRGAR